MVVAGVFLVLSADEILEFHEGVALWFSSAVAEVPVLIGPFSWVLVLLPFIVVFVAV